MEGFEPPLSSQSDKSLGHVLICQDYAQAGSFFPAPVSRAPVWTRKTNESVSAGLWGWLCFLYCFVLFFIQLLATKWMCNDASN